MNCKHSLDYFEMGRILPEDQHQKYDRLLLLHSLEKMPEVIWCPKQGCSNAILVEDLHGSCKVTANCQHSFCILCKENHPGSCEQFQQYLNSSELNELEMKFLEWFDSIGHRCPNCKVPIEKNGKPNPNSQFPSMILTNSICRGLQSHDLFSLFSSILLVVP